MKFSIKEMLKNFTYSLSSNFITLIISTLVVLVVPKVIGAEQYGFWQLYLFYSSYVGFLHLGWVDGIYLRYGGEKYENLERKLFSSQFYSLLLLEVFFSLVLLLFSFLSVSDNDKLFILVMVSIDIVLFNLRGFLILLLQTTNRIREYAQINILDRIMYILLITMLLLVGINNYKLLVVSDIISKLVSLLYSIYICRDIVFFKGRKFEFLFTEIYLNIRVGIKLMISNIANNLIIGIARFGIEVNWSVVTFGKVSLTLSVSNMFMTFINALGLVIYPIIRRISNNKIVIMYNSLRDLLMPIILLVLIFYYPLNYILSFWLPDYAESLDYMGILFPIVIYQSKMSLLLNPFLKALRKEKLLLIINIISLGFSMILIAITAFILNDLDLTIFSIFLSITFRGVFAELLISKHIQIKVMKDIIIELVMSLIFIFSTSKIDSGLGILIYTLTYMVYFFIKKKSFFYAAMQLKELSINQY